MHFCEQNQEKGCISDDHISHCLCFVPLQMLPLTNGLFGGHNCICMANLNQWPRRASLANVQKHCYNFLSLRVLFGSLWSSKQTKLMIISHHYSSCSLLQLASATLCLILLFRLCWHRVCLFVCGTKHAHFLQSSNSDLPGQVFSPTPRRRPQRWWWCSPIISGQRKQQSRNEATDKWTNEQMNKRVFSVWAGSKMATTNHWELFGQFRTNERQLLDDHCCGCGSS